MCETQCINFNLDSLEKIANIIIASLTLCLAYYIFVYQRKKDKTDRKIQWFKELIIQPRLNEVNIFFDEISKLKLEIKSNDLTDSDKDILIKKIKSLASSFRKNFLIVIQNLTPTLFSNLQKSIDKLTDDLTQAISNDELKLCNENTYEREIGIKIQDTHSFVLKQIFEYEGE
jgi:hypothetical protein